MPWARVAQKVPWVYCWGKQTRSASLLEGIVADGVRTLDRRFQVAALEDMKLPIGLVRPDTRQVIGLEFEPDRVRGRLWPDPRIDAEQVLNMVAVLVGHDIGLRELGFRAARVCFDSRKWVR